MSWQVQNGSAAALSLAWGDHPTSGQIAVLIGFFAHSAMGHPVGGCFGLEVDDGAVLGVEDPAHGGEGCSWRAGFGQGDGLPQAEALELAVN